MDIRRRTGEAVVTSSETSEDDPGTRSSVDAALEVEEGKRLYTTAQESGFAEMGKLIRGVNSFVNAATDGSSEAVDWLKTFLVSPPMALDSLPSDLLDMMNIAVDGSEEEKEVCQVAKQMFRAMAEGRKEIPQKEIDTAAQRLMTSDLMASEESREFVKLRGSVKRLMNHAIVTDEKGVKVVGIARLIGVGTRGARGLQSP